MEITQNIMKKAEDVLRFEGVKDLPKQIGSTPFYLGETSDERVFAHGVINYEGVEYRIGTLKKL